MYKSMKLEENKFFMYPAVTIFIMACIGVIFIVTSRVFNDLYFLESLSVSVVIFCVLCIIYNYFRKK